jgi:hypothetical protein
MAIDQIKESLMRIVNEENRRREEREFSDFCEALLSLPANLEVMPEETFVADIELQPLRWMSLGIDLLQSHKVTGYVQLADGARGPAMSSYLPYPVFQMATEIFLKGMWLCQFADCRGLTYSSYIDEAKRGRYQEKLSGLSHDLLKIIGAVREIPHYQTNPSALQFLNLVEGIVRRFYFPPYEAEKRNRWADNRYPKRVYDDTARKSVAESFQSYPRADWVEKLFRQAERDVDDLWQLRAGLKERDQAPAAESREDDV